MSSRKKVPLHLLQRPSAKVKRKKKVVVTYHRHPLFPHEVEKTVHHL